MRLETDTLTFLETVASDAPAHDFYQLLRRLECLSAPAPRWGTATMPTQETVRFGQTPDLTFAPSSVVAVERRHARIERERRRSQERADLELSDEAIGRVHVLVRLFGLLGPNGPMPLSFTEHVFERLHHASDPTLNRFVNVLQHRMIALFYRAWAQAQPHVQRDRPGEDGFASYLGAVAGLQPAAFRDRDTVPDEAKFRFAARLGGYGRTSEGLAAILQEFFCAPAGRPRRRPTRDLSASDDSESPPSREPRVRVEEFVGHWMTIDERDRTCLGRPGAVLGRGAVAGERVWDRQHKIRLHVGPLSFERFEAFLPGGVAVQQLADWVRLYLSFELAWDLRLVLAREEVPTLKVGQGARLGWTTWLGHRRSPADADDVCIDVEALLTAPGEVAA